MKLKVVGATFVACLLATSSVWAGGYDTPMLYTARHVGMGGAAVSYVNDPSALFHNPAGLARVKKLSLMADFTFLLAGIKSAPDATTGALDSDTIKAPFFLIGGAYRVTDFLVLGLGVYPVASASASYSYGTTTENSTTLVFLETALGAAVNIDAANLTIGASYRITYVSLSRKQAFDNGSELLNFDMKGWNFAGFRLGVQWAPLPKYLTFGFSYRHQTTTEVTADEVTALALKITNGSTEFTLPSRLIFGVRGDYANLGLAVDVEYALNSQNTSAPLKGTDPTGTPLSVDNVFDWKDAITFRVGSEYRIKLGPEGKMSILPRLGFIFDGTTSNRKYPSAFGTPPTPTYVITAGLGWESGPFRVNLAYAYRFGSTTVAPTDLANPSAGDKACAFCSFAGDYKITASSIAADFSYDFQ